MGFQVLPLFTLVFIIFFILSMNIFKFYCLNIITVSNVISELSQSLSLV
jgi:hypothetical protein